MAQTTQQRTDAARELALRFYATATANLNHDDLVAAVVAIDNAMDSLPPVLGQTLTIKQNLAAALPEPFNSNSTAQQKALVLVVWSMKETGVI